MYYWSHTEVPQSVPQTPGRLSTLSWPPVSPCASDIFVSPCSPSMHDFIPQERTPRSLDHLEKTPPSQTTTQTTSSISTADNTRTTDETPHQITEISENINSTKKSSTSIDQPTQEKNHQSTEKTSENNSSKKSICETTKDKTDKISSSTSSKKSSTCEIPKEKTLRAELQKISELEDYIKDLQQELEKYKTLVEIQTLTSNVVRDFGSPTKGNFKLTPQLDSSDSKSSSPSSTPSHPLPDLISPVENRTKTPKTQNGVETKMITSTPKENVTLNNLDVSPVKIETSNDESGSGSLSGKELTKADEVSSSLPLQSGIESHLRPSGVEDQQSGVRIDQDQSPIGLLLPTPGKEGKHFLVISSFI